MKETNEFILTLKICSRSTGVSSLPVQVSWVQTLRCHSSSQRTWLVSFFAKPLLFTELSSHFSLPSKLVERRQMSTQILQLTRLPNSLATATWWLASLLVFPTLCVDFALECLDHRLCSSTLRHLQASSACLSSWSSEVYLDFSVSSLESSSRLVQSGQLSEWN